MCVQSVEGLSYCIFDPTGNITALAESVVPVAEQPSVAMQIMKRHPEVEQVGFVRLESGEPGVHAELRMAGGEFCGNATMSAAALYALRTRPDGSDGCSEAVRLRVSGAARPVEVALTQTAYGAYDAGVRMPPALGIEEVPLSFGDVSATLPVVHMEGISHIVIGQDAPFFSLRDDPFVAEQAVCAWCALLGTDGLGLMFLQKDAAVHRLTPLVYVPASGTVFWENSCASGSAATGMCLSSRAGAPAALAFCEPGGILRVESDPTTKVTRLYGSVRLLEEFPVA